MKLCIIDPACHIPTFKVLFPDAEIFSHEPDDKFYYFGHPTREQIFNLYNFYYRTDWESIHSSTFDIVFVVAPLIDYFGLDENGSMKHNIFMRNKIQEILDKNKFKKVVLFDMYDYDIDPNLLGCTWPIDVFFKRNYSKSKKYKSNVFPYPFVLYMKPCLLKMIIATKPTLLEKNRIDKVLWCGTLFNHEDPLYNVYKNRLGIYNEIKDSLLTFSRLSNEDYKNWLKVCKIGVDLVGVGEPNKRLFEILQSGALLMTMSTDLEWPFPERFAEEIYFSTGEEFKQKSSALLKDPTLYQKALSIQNIIIEKYFNKEWLAAYIVKTAGIFNYCTRDLITSIQENKPVVFIKLGDGEFNCANYQQGHNCDRDNYSPQKGFGIIHTVKYITENHPNAYFGVWWNLEIKKFWESCTSVPIQWRNYHSILMDHEDMNSRNSNFKNKIEFYKTVKDSTLKKVYICNPLLQKVKYLLNVDTLLFVPLNNWFDTEFNRLIEEAKKEYDEKGTIFLFSCGMGAKPLLCELVKLCPNGMFFDVGSALDFICTQRNSRGWNFTYSEVKESFQDLLPEDWDDPKYDFIVESAKNELGVHVY
jgi:hypothetical protein